MTGTTARVAVLPRCQFCDDAARYDAATKSGPWAYMCEKHWEEHRAYPKLGIGKGQKLVAPAGATGRVKREWS